MEPLDKPLHPNNVRYMENGIRFDFRRPTIGTIRQILAPKIM